MSRLILVADDERDIAEIVSELLEAAGYRTVRVHDGQQALEAFQHHRPAAAVMDIKMPVIDGLEVIRRIRSDPALASIPVIVLTATRVISDLEEQFRRLAVYRCLAKPFEPDQLIETVRSALKES